MKSIFSILLVCVVALSAAAAPASDAVGTSRRDALIKRYTFKISSEDDLLKAAEKGYIYAINSVTDVSLLQATDKFGNNVFHLAKDAVTLQALAAVARRLDENYLTRLNSLRNQRNYMGETPLLYHVNMGKQGTWKSLYSGTRLQENILAANAVSDRGGALVKTADVRKSLVRQEASDDSGRTVAQAALANNMSDVVTFFQTNAPYLFEQML
ncbi:MAG: hypothetical protein MJ053_03720 [Elusimicrobiaceae bacterium]|nr:hypothetical protein [Elusimicrobiaceae bacterium]